MIHPKKQRKEAEGRRRRSFFFQHLTRGSWRRSEGREKGWRRDEEAGGA
jgi:hypothetical protein